MAGRGGREGRTADAVRFGGEFGPARGAGTKGVSLSTFRSLVWISNVGGLLLVALALELMVYEGRFWGGLLLMLVGIAIAMFPNQYEIVGMGQDGAGSEDSGGSEPEPAAEPTA